jgi:uncharacterized membrane protein
VPPITFLLFTAGVCAVWLLCLIGALRRKPYYVFVLIFMAAYCYCSEFVAIRLGKYFYGSLFPEICSGASTGPLPWPFSLLQYAECQAPNWCIPIAVVAMESSLFMAILWTVDLLTSARYAKPFLAGLLGVNLDAIIDPVASASMWCSEGVGGGTSLPGLGFWTWFTTDQNPGYWFGVPILNYTTWFVSMASFTFAVRWVERRVVRDKHGPLAQLGAALLAMAGLLVIEFILVLVFQTILELRSSLAWQGGVLAVLMGVSLLIILPAMRGFRLANPIDWTTVLPQLFLLLFFPAALLLNGGFPGKGGLLLVALVTFVIGAGFAFAPYCRFHSR